MQNKGNGAQPLMCKKCSSQFVHWNTILQCKPHYHSDPAYSPGYKTVVYQSKFSRACLLDPEHSYVRSLDVRKLNSKDSHYNYQQQDQKLVWHL